MSTMTDTVLRSAHGAGDWVRKHPGEPMWTVGWSMEKHFGTICLHANPRCGRMINPVPLLPSIVQTLWDKDVETGAASGQNGVMWCMSCAVDPVK